MGICKRAEGGFRAIYAWAKAMVHALKWHADVRFAASISFKLYSDLVWTRFDTILKISQSYLEPFFWKPYPI